MSFSFQFDETGFRVNVEFPAWVEKIHDYVFEEQGDEE